MRTSTIRTATGLSVKVRGATAADLTMVNELHRRCSPATLISRYAAGRDLLRDHEWRRMVDPSRGRTLVLADPGEPGAAIGFATLLRAGADGAADVSLLLRDDWQSVGIGRAMAHHLLTVALQLRFAGLVASIAPDNVRARKLLRSLGARPRLDEYGEAYWAVPA